MRLRVAISIAVALPLFAGSPAAADKIADKRAEASRLTSQIEVQGARLSELAEQFNEARLRSGNLTARLLEARAGVLQTDAAAARTRDKLRRSAVDAYVRGGALPVLPVLARGDGSDFGVRSQYVDAVANRERDELDAMRRARQDLVAEREQLEAAQQQANAAIARVEAAKAAAKAAQEALRGTLGKVQGELAGLVKAEEARRSAEAAKRAQRELAARRAREHSSPSTKRTSAPPPAAPGAASAVAEAKRQLGKPYDYGAAGPNSFDCSGLTMWSWRAGGKSLPHSSRAQFSATTRVDLDQVQPGDLVFYGSPIHHVGIVVGNGQMIEASEEGTPVRYASIYRRDFAGAGRVN